MLFGCGGDDNGVNKATLRIINFRVEDQSYYDWLIDKFEKENRGVTVHYDAVDTANYPQLVGARVASGQLDVFFNQPSDVFDGNYSGNMLPLNDLGILDKFVEEYLKTGKLYDPKEKVSNQLCIPLNTVGMIVFYNKDIFRENNLKVPTNWSELVTLLETLKALPNVEAPIIYGGRDQWPANIYVNAVEAQIVRDGIPDFYTKIRDWDNNPECRFNNELWIETLEKVKTILSYAQPDSTGLSYSSAPGLFAAGNPHSNKKYPLYVDGSWSSPQIIGAQPDFEIGTFILPANDVSAKNKYLPFKTGGGVSVFNRSTNVELAKKFIEFHFRDDNYKTYLEMTQMGSVLKDIKQEHPLVANIYDDTYEPILIVENTIVPGMPWGMSVGVTNMILGITTPQELANSINNNIEQTKANWMRNANLKN